MNSIRLLRNIAIFLFVIVIVASFEITIIQIVLLSVIAIVTSGLIEVNENRLDIKYKEIVESVEKSVLNLKDDLLESSNAQNIKVIDTIKSLEVQIGHLSTERGSDFKDLMKKIDLKDEGLQESIMNLYKQIDIIVSLKKEDRCFFEGVINSILDNCKTMNGLVKEIKQLSVNNYRDSKVLFESKINELRESNDHVANKVDFMGSSLKDTNVGLQLISTSMETSSLNFKESAERLPSLVSALQESASVFSNLESNLEDLKDCINDVIKEDLLGDLNDLSYDIEKKRSKSFEKITNSIQEVLLLQNKQCSVAQSIIDINSNLETKINELNRKHTYFEKLNKEDQKLIKKYL